MQGRVGGFRSFLCQICRPLGHTEATVSRRRKQAVRSAEFGRNSRTGPSAPTVGVSLARSIMAGANLVFPLLLDSTKERVQSHAFMGSAERGGERRHSLQRVAAGRGSNVNIVRVSAYLIFRVCGLTRASDNLKQSQIIKHVVTHLLSPQPKVRVKSVLGQC